MISDTVKFSRKSKSQRFPSNENNGAFISFQIFPRNCLSKFPFFFSSILPSMMRKRWKSWKIERKMLAEADLPFFCSPIHNPRWVKLVKEKNKRFIWIHYFGSILSCFLLNFEIHFFRLTSKRNWLSSFEEQEKLNKISQDWGTKSSYRRGSLQSVSHFRTGNFFPAYRHTQITNLLWCVWVVSQLCQKLYQKSSKAQRSWWLTKVELKILNQITRIFNLY